VEVREISFGWDWPWEDPGGSRRRAYFIPSKVIIKLLVLSGSRGRTGINKSPNWTGSIIYYLILM
jgi:hypothetical protein